MTMLVVLQADTAPLRTLRETDSRGFERTFWLWRHERWAVVTRSPTGRIHFAHHLQLEMSVRAGEGTILAEVHDRPLSPTLPAPSASTLPPAELVASGVLPVASRADGDDQADTSAATDSPGGHHRSERPDVVRRNDIAARIGGTHGAPAAAARGGRRASSG